MTINWEMYELNAGLPGLAESSDFGIGNTTEQPGQQLQYGLLALAIAAVILLVTE